MIQFERRTLRGEVSFEGKGLHTGVPVKVTVHPGDKGIAFRLGGSRFAATPENVTDTTRSTKVGDVGTVEHLMAALAGLEITDAEVELDAPEVPGYDGSALPFVKAFQHAGVELIGVAELPSLFSRVFLQEDEGPKIAIGKGSGHWRYDYDLGQRFPGLQSYESEDAARDFPESIAPARTFALAEEIPFIIQAGLGKGLDEASCVVLGIEGYKNEVRFEDEPARHKLLDLIGDLYLAGVPIRALNVVAEKSGHRTNVKAASLLAEAMRIMDA